MKRKAIPTFLNEVKRRIEDVWDKPPTEIQNLRNPMGVFGHSFPMIDYSFHGALSASSELFRLREHAVKKDVMLEPLKLLGKEACAYYGNFLATYGLTDTGKILNEASEIIAEIENPGEFIELCDILCIYLNKMGGFGWVDAEMKWAYISSFFDMI